MKIKLDEQSGRYFPEESEIKKLERKDKIVENSWKTHPEKFSGDMLSYQNWFDSCDSIKSCIAKGEIDFHNRILTNDLYKFVGDPRDKSAFDIGFGGGRLMLAASRVFKNVSGVDVLSDDARTMTKKFLEENGLENYRLYNPENINSIKDSSIDFVYSYIVFQHFSSIDYFHKYFSNIKRILKPGGVGVIFFGLINDTANPNMKKIINEQGYIHWHDSFSNGCRGSTLYYSPEWIKSQIENEYNMSVISMARYAKQPWVDIKNLSSQFCAKFINNKE